MVSNIFCEDDERSNKQVMNELNKIIKTKLNLDSSRYTKNKLLDELKKIIYQLPLSIQFILKENSKNIIEYADIINNQDTDNNYEDIMNDNEYSLLSDYSLDGNIYLYDANDFYRNSQFDSERKNFVQSRYFTKVIKNIRTDNFNQFVRQYNKIFSDFNEKYLKLTDYGQKSLDKELVTKLKDNYENISDNILNGISFLL